MAIDLLPVENAELYSRLFIEVAAMYDILEMCTFQ